MQGMFLTACVAFFFFSGPVLHQLMQGVFLSAHTAFCFLLSRDQCFISKGYDATTHFETTVEDVLDMYKRITGGPSHTHTRTYARASHTSVHPSHARTHYSWDLTCASASWVGRADMGHWWGCVRCSHLLGVHALAWCGCTQNISAVSVCQASIRRGRCICRRCWAAPASLPLMIKGA